MGEQTEHLILHSVGNQALKGQLSGLDSKTETMWIIGLTLMSL